jgi:virulence factor Mce-like protein
VARVLRFKKSTLVKVLAFMAVSAVFTVWLAVKIGNLQLFSHTYTLDAEFANAAGVFKGDSVKLAGVDVGRVSWAKIDNGHAVVQFDVDNSVKLTRDTTVAIRWRNVLGQRYLYLYPGTGNGAPLQDGDTIPLSHTENAGDLDQFLNELGPILRAIDPAKANAFVDAVNTALAGNTGEVRNLIDNGALLAGRLSSMDKQIQTLVGSSNTVISTYAHQSKALAEILDNLDHLGGRLDSMTGNIDSLITNFTDVQSQLDKLLRQNKGNIDTDLSDLNVLTSLLAHNKGQLATTLCSLPAGVTPYFETTSWGEWFNVRVVEFILKDNNGNTLASVAETPNERNQKPIPPYTCGTPGNNGTHSIGTQLGPLGLPTVGFGDLGSLIASALGGSGSSGLPSGLPTGLPSLPPVPGGGGG